MNVSVADRRSARRMVFEHLSNRAIIPLAGEPTDDPADGTALALGVSGITLLPGGELTAFGRRCHPQERRLTDLLNAGGEAGLYFADRPALEAAHGAGYDPVLYHAFRDFLPPRDISGDHCLPAGTPGYETARGSGYMFADLIVYQAGTLPGGEFFRSTGHWNLPWQLEIFQTLIGRVLMLVGGRDSEGQLFLYGQACGPGEVMAVPFGVWHVSYVLDGPAVVFNVTTDLRTLVGEHRAAAVRQGPAKYCRAAPIAVTARRCDAGYYVVGSPAARRRGPLAGPPGTDWMRPFLAATDSLADLHLYASSSRLAGLQRAALQAYRPDWPPHCGFGKDADITPERPAERGQP
jgi:hypothetical protein